MNYCSECGSRVEALSLDGATRYKCINDECSQVYWNNPTPVVAALVKLDGKYVIARNRQWPDGIFSLITGYLEAGEEVEPAVLREVSEELGLDGKVINYLGHHMFKEKNQLILAFEIEAAGNLKLGEELVEVKQLSIEELVSYDFKPLYITEAVIDNWKILSE